MKMAKFIDLAARILLAAIFFMAGVSKIGAYAATQGYMESQGIPGMLLPAVIGLEIIGPVLLVIGWQTRPVALALAGFTVVTAFVFHLNLEDQMQAIMFMKNLAIAGGLLLLFSHGAGGLSMDARSDSSTR
jgi:putative oxidoreductase